MICFPAITLISELYNTNQERYVIIGDFWVLFRDKSQDILFVLIPHFSRPSELSEHMLGRMSLLLYYYYQNPTPQQLPDFQNNSLLLTPNKKKKLKCPRKKKLLALSCRNISLWALKRFYFFPKKKEKLQRITFLNINCTADGEGKKGLRYCKK